MRLDLRSAGASLAPNLGPLDELDPAGRARARTAWHHRMVNEYTSARVFEALARQVRAAGLADPWRSEIDGMADEERHHGALCAGVLTALGGEAVAEVADLPEVPEHDAPPVEALLMNVLSVSCLSETTAVALLQAEAEEAGPPALQELVRRILADEIGHARFGWRLLDTLAPTLDTAARARLSAYLVPAFRQLADTHLSGPHDVTPSHAARRLGACDDRTAERLVVATVEQVIIPALTAHGLDTARAWPA